MDEAKVKNDASTIKNEVRRGPVRFGYEKPALAGPGRPRLPEGTKQRRDVIRKALEVIAADAVPVLEAIIKSPRSLDRDRIRAAEVVMAHSVPKLEEHVDDGHDNPWVGLPPAQLATLIKILATRSSQRTDPAGVGN